jgi:protein TonB
MVADPGTIHPDGTPATAGDSPLSPSTRILSTQLTSHAAAPVATSQSSLLAGEGATIFVYSADPEFQSAIEAAAEDQYAVSPVEEWSELVAAVEGGECKILLLDADTLRGRVDWRILRLQAAAEWSVIMIAASRERANGLMELLWQHRIHRLVLKPLGHGVTRILMESAVVRFRQLRDDPSQRPEASREERQPGSRLSLWLHLRNPQLVVTYAVLLVAVVLMVGVLLVPLPSPLSNGPIATESAVAPVAPAAPESEIVAEQLQLATLAISQGRVSTREGDSALDYYSAALVLEPDNGEALGQLATLLDSLFADVESALLSSSLASAEVTLAHIRRVQPESTRLSFLDRQLERARAEELDQFDAPAFDLGTSLPVVAAIPSLSELDSLLTVAEVRLQNGQLMLPAGDSALDYLLRAEALSPDDPIVVEIRPELGEAISVSARVAFDSGDLADAERRIDAARTLGAAEEPLAALDTEISEIRTAAAEQVVVDRHEALFADGQARLDSGQFLAPEQDNAYYYLSTLNGENPDYAGLEAAWEVLANGVAANAAEAIGAGDWAAGESWLAGLEQVAPDTELLPELQTELETSRRQAEYLAVAAPPSELALVGSEPLVYPPSAHQASIEGWVDLEFIVGRDGNVTEIVVVGAEPEGEFEQAAITAVTTYRFEPFELDGRLYQRRLHLRVRFAIQ